MSNMERKLLLSAELAGLNAYLPRHQDTRGRERIMFPGYVFVDRSQAHDSVLFNLRGGRGPIVFGGQVACLPAGVIEQFRARECPKGYIQFGERFEQDQPLVVSEGPFKSQVVLYRGMDREQRELALVSLLGREVVRSFDRHELEALPAEKLN
jgi:transcription antitermination factor NusG